VRTELTHRYARVLVVDEGIGLKDKDRTTVFEEFSQVDATDQRAVGGTGLGMNISKRIAEAMGGGIDFRPNEKKGTTFFIDLPLGNMDEKTDTTTMVEMPMSKALRKFRSKFLNVA
jgi:signal transduction histidine kinase